jgi:hypothetical protein
MTVAQLIELLKQLPQDAPVSVNDEGSGIFHEDIDTVFYVPVDPVYGDRAAAILVVNPNE